VVDRSLEIAAAYYTVYLTGVNVWQTKQLQLDDRMDLSSYLLKPVQRMGKYALLLSQVSKECPQTHPDYADLKV